MVYQIEKMLKEHGDKISGTERTDVESALADAKKALEGTDATAMNSSRERLTQASHKLAEAMYKSAPSTGPQAGPDASTNGAGPAQEEKKDEGVIDAEYVDVEPKK
jgi:molecular chaperone DnaK